MQTLKTKVLTDYYHEIVKKAHSNKMTESDLLRICVEDIVHGHYEIKDGHLVPTEEYSDVLIADKWTKQFLMKRD